MDPGMRLSPITLSSRCGLVLLLPALLAIPAPLRAANAPLRQFLDTYCMSCHDGQVKKGGPALAALPDDFKNPSSFDKWVKVHDRIRAGEMPPRARKTRPQPAETAAALKALDAGLVDAEQARRARDGR